MWCEKISKKDFIRFSISFLFQYWNYYIDGHDHIRNVAKEKTRINTTSENVVIVFSDLKVDSNRRAAHWKTELWEENRNKIWVQVSWKVGFFHSYIQEDHIRKIWFWGIILIYITQVNSSSGKYNCCDFILHSWYLLR